MFSSSTLVLFSHSLSSPSFVAVRFRLVDYYDLAYHGVRSRGRNFYLRLGPNDDVSTSTEIEQGDGNIEQPSIGVWHILPASMSERFGSDVNEAAMERALDEESHGMVY
jgi:hypothetical protein